MKITKKNSRTKFKQIIPFTLRKYERIFGKLKSKSSVQAFIETALK